MLAKTHVIGGIAAGLLTASLTGGEPLYIVAASALGSLVPDIDHGKSKAGKELPVISWIFSTVFGHRTFSHSLLFVILIAWTLLQLPVHLDLVAGILVGILSHMILDAITKRGIKLFYPLRINFGLPLFKTGGAGESFVAFSLILYCIYMLTDLIPL